MFDETVCRFPDVPVRVGVRRLLKGMKSALGDHTLFWAAILGLAVIVLDYLLAAHL